MPTISFSFRDFQELLGRRLPVDEFGELVTLYAKGEVEGYDSTTSNMKIALDDTNTPYMWCVEGLARFFRGVLGIEKGLPKFTTAESNRKILVDGSVKRVRPFIAAFVAEGRNIDSYLLEQLIQLQEKFCESYGRSPCRLSLSARHRPRSPNASTAWRSAG